MSTINLRSRDLGIWTQVVGIIWIAVCMTSNGVLGGTTPSPDQGGPRCPEGAVTTSHPDLPCQQDYLRCNNGTWGNAKCVVGVMNFGTGQCVPYTEACPEPATDKTFNLRVKRQAIPANSCSQYFECPQEVNKTVLQINWENCGEYISCISGQLSIGRCETDKMKLYNGVRLSCEDFDSDTNVCTRRESTVYTS